MRGLRPQPDHRHLARRLHLRQAAAVGEPAARADHPAGRRRHDVLQRLPRLRGPLRRPARHRSTRLRAVHYATQLAIDSGMPEDEIVNSHPVVVHAPGDRPTRALRQRQLHEALRRLVGRRQPTAARPPLRAVRQASSTPAVTAGRRATSSSGTTAACSTRWSATPTARSARCTAPPSQETTRPRSRHDRHPLDRQPRRPRGRTPRRVDHAPPREVPRRRPAHRDGAAGHADPRRRQATARRPAPTAPDVAWWFYEDHQYSVKRLIAAAGYPADEIGFDGITYDQMRPGCWQPQARLDDMTMNHVEASLSLPQLPALLRADLPARQGQGAREALRRGVQRLAGRRVVRGQQRPPDPAVPGPAVGRRARGRRGAAQRGTRRAGGRVLRAAVVARARRASTPATGSRSSRRARRPAPSWRCTSARAPRRSRRRPTRPTRCRPSTCSPTARLSLIDFLYSGVLVRYPELKLLYAEAQIGWIPYVLERVDDVWETHRGWSNSQTQRRRAAVAVLLPAGSAAASSRTASASRTSTASAATTSRSRPTTRTRTAPGRTRTRSPRSCSVTSTPRRCTTSCAATPSACSTSRVSATAPGRVLVTALDPAATTVVDRTTLRTQLERMLGALGVPADQAPVDRRQPGRGRPARRRLPRRAPHGALQRAGAQRSPPPRHRGHDGRRPRLHRAARRRPRLRAGRGRRRDRSRGRAGPRARRRHGRGPRAHPPRCARVLHDARGGAGLLRDGVPERRHHRAALRRHHEPVLDQPVLVRGARRYATPTSCTTSPPPRPPATRSCSPASAATRRSPRAGPTTRTAIPTTDPQAASVSQLQWFGGHKGFGIGMLVEIMAGLLADSCFGATSTPSPSSPAGTASPRAPASWCSTSSASCPSTSSAPTSTS